MRFISFVFLMTCLLGGTVAQAALYNLKGSISSATLYENDTQGNTSVDVNLTLETDVNFGAVVEMRAQPQGNGAVDATPGADYTYPATFTLAYDSTVAGVLRYKGKMTVQAFSDSLIEPAERINILVYVKLQTSANYMVELTLGDTTPKPIVTIRSNNGSDPLHSTDAFEGGASSSIIIERSGSTNRPLEVYIQIDGSALDGIDYEYVPGSFTFNVGQSQKTITIQPLDDSDFEGTEDVGIRLLRVGVVPEYDVAPDDGGNQSKMVTLNINDNDPVPTPTPTPFPTMTPMPTPLPTPHPLANTLLHPYRVFGIYTPQRVLYSRDNNSLFLANGPLLSTINPANLQRVFELNNTFLADLPTSYSSGYSYYVQDDVRDFAVSFNRETAVITIKDRAALWDMQGRYIKQWYIHTPNDPAAPPVTAVAYQTLTYPNRVATGDNTIIRVWDADSAKQVIAFGNPVPATILRLQFSPDGRYLFAGTAPNANGIGLARVFELSTGKRVYQAAFAPDIQVNDAAFSPDSARLIYTATNGRITVVDLSSMTDIYRFNSAWPTYAVSYAQDGSRFVTQWNNMLRIWDSETFQQLNEIEFTPYDDRSPTTTIQAVTLAPNNKQVAVSFGDRMVIYDAESTQSLLTLRKENITEGKFMKRYPLVVLRSGTSFAAYNAYSGEKTVEYLAPDIPADDEGNPTDPPQSNVVGFDMDKTASGLTRLVTLTDDQTTSYNLTFYDALSGELIPGSPVVIPLVGSKTFNQVAIAPDGKVVVLGSLDKGSPGSQDGYMWTYPSDATTSMPTRMFSSLHNEGITALKFMKNSFDLGSVGLDAKFLIDDAIVTGPQKVLFDHDLFTERLNSLDFSDDETEVLTGSPDQYFLWNLPAFKLVKRSSGFHGPAIYVPGHGRNANVLAHTGGGGSNMLDNSFAIFNKASLSIGARYMSIATDTGLDRGFNMMSDGSMFAARGGKHQGADTVWIWPTVVPENAAENWVLYE